MRSVTRLKNIHFKKNVSESIFFSKRKFFVPLRQKVENQWKETFDLKKCKKYFSRKSRKNGKKCLSFQIHKED